MVDRLLDAGTNEVAVADVSSTALSRAEARVGQRGALVRWLRADVTGTDDLGTFDVWHDRAVFHFLTERESRERYIERAAQTVKPTGYLIIATFAPDGPSHCSGLPVRSYDDKSLALELGSDFHLISSRRHNHVTPAGTRQPFVYAMFGHD